MKKIIAFILMMILVLTLVACDVAVHNDGEMLSAVDSDSYSVGSKWGVGAHYSSSVIPKGTARDSIVYEGGDIPWEEFDLPYEESENREITAGSITAKAWNDNDNYTQWKKLFAAKTDNDPAGKLADFSEGIWAKDTLHRVKITVTEGETPVAGAEVSYYGMDQKQWISRTDVNGVAYLFPSEETGSVTVKSGSVEETAAFTADDRDIKVNLSASETKLNVIKMMFVIDATGSMGDEMAYIATELADVVERVTAQAAQVRIDIAVLFYRDDGDQEKFAYHDFVNVSVKAGLDGQIAVLKAEDAEGGGDLPEAMDEALALAVDKNWGDGNSTNLMFLVLDAPPHDDETKSLRWATAVKDAAAKGIRICPILCSGADDLTEYVTRTSALMTGGTSIFVTDDSGIGGEHLDPELPDATVELLNDLMVRLIVGYHTGDFGTPVAWNADEDAQEGQEQTPVVTEKTKADPLAPDAEDTTASKA